MDKEKVRSSLKTAIEEEIPSSQVNLWPAVKASLVAGQESTQQGERMITTHRRRMPRLALAMLLIAALLGLAFVTPQGRALAQTVLQFFTRADSRSFPLQPWQIPAHQNDTSVPTAEPPAPLMTLAEAETQAGFNAAELPSVPVGFDYLGARLYGHAISIEYEAHGGGGSLILMQSQSGYLQSDWDKVPAEAIVPVKVGNLDAEFAQGTFVVPPGAESATWNPAAPILRLRWMKDGVWFELTKFGNVQPIEYLDRDGMIKLAESLR